VSYVQQASFNAGEISPSLHARVDLDKFHAALKTCKNWFVHEHGGISTRPGSKYIAEVKDSSAAARLIPFEYNDAQAYALEFGDQTLRVIKAGAQVELANAITGATQANPCVITATGHAHLDGDTVTIAGVTGMTELNGNSYTVANATANTFELSGIDSTAYTAYSAGGTSTGPVGFSTPYAAADLFGIRYSQSGDTMTLTSTGYAAYSLTRASDTAWTLSAITIGTTLAAPTSPSATPTGSGSVDYSYKVASITDDGDESLPTAEFTCTNGSLSDTVFNDLSWTAEPDADRYVVYKYRGGVWGYIGTADGVDFRDDNIEPDLLDTPNESIDPFTSSNHPACSVYHQQRLVFAGMVNGPQDIEFSRIGHFYNFNQSFPTKADAAFGLTLNSKKQNTIKHLVSFGDLLAFTAGGIWKLGTGDQGLTPTSVVADQEGYVGCSDVPPLESVDSVVYVAKAGNVVRDVAFEFTQDGYTGRNLSILAKHLLRNKTIVDWCYAADPYSVFWMVRSDGALLGLTYNREHRVVAWHQHETDGLYESVCAVPEDSVTAVYAIVNRTIGGQTKRYIERFVEREFDTIEDAFCVDCGITYDGTATTTIAGLDHIEGETVSILGDGNVMPQKVVSGGQVTLPNAASKVHVGLPYDCDVETLRPTADGATLLPLMKNINEVAVQVENSRGLWVGRDADNLVEYKQRTTEDYGEAIAWYTGLIHILPYAGWDDYGTLFIRQSDPLPVTILSIVPDLVVGG
jgi:hypothetical protein